MCVFVDGSFVFGGGRRVTENHPSGVLYKHFIYQVSFALEKHPMLFRTKRKSIQKGVSKAEKQKPWISMLLFG